MISRTSARLGCIVFVAYLLAAGSLHAARKKVQEVPLYEELRTLKIQNNVGNITISGKGKKPGIQIQKLKYVERKCAIESTNNKAKHLQIVSVKKLSAYGPQKCQVKITVIVPPDTRLIVQNGVGSLTIRDMREDISYEVGAGNTILKGVYSPSVDATIGAGTLDISSSNIEKAVIKNGSGNMTLFGEFLDLSVDSGSGNLNIKGTKEQPHAHYKIHLGVGNLNIALPKSIGSLNTTLVTGRGRAKTWFKEDKQAQSSVDATTGIGDIAVKAL